MASRQELLRLASSELAAVSSSAYLDAQLLLAFVLNTSREDLLINNEVLVDEAQQQKFSALLARRKNYEPIAYLLGEKEFWGQKFYVNSAVLIPRPETELLIEQALKILGEQKEPYKILDLGTGSGCIAITLALELKKQARTFHIVATDYSSEALAVAEKNAANLNVPSNLVFLKSAWFENQEISAFGSYDLIVSNPPYIAENSTAVVEETKRYEPPTALYAGSEGLDDLKLIISQAPKYLSSRGVLIMECGHDQFSALQKFIKEDSSGLHFEDPEFLLDLAQRERLVMLRKKLPQT